MNSNDTHVRVVTLTAVGNGLDDLFTRLDRICYEYDVSADDVVNHVDSLGYTDIADAYFNYVNENDE